MAVSSPGGSDDDLDGLRGFEVAEEAWIAAHETREALAWLLEQEAKGIKTVGLEVVFPLLEQEANLFGEAVEAARKSEADLAVAAECVGRATAAKGLDPSDALRLSRLLRVPLKRRPSDFHHQVLALTEAVAIVAAKLRLTSAAGEEWIDFKAAAAKIGWAPERVRALTRRKNDPLPSSKEGKCLLVDMAALRRIAALRSPRATFGNQDSRESSRIKP